MIECSECGDNVWCCWDTDRWICKNCFLQENNSYEDWQELNEENKQYRENKRRQKANLEFGDF